MSSNAIILQSPRAASTQPVLDLSRIEGLIDVPSSELGQLNPNHGSIVRIVLRNWVTFDKCELNAHAGLNLILGPNGSGKSSIVCAICIGLAGKTKSLGRADKASDFIKRGKTRAFIEIELFNSKRSKKQHSNYIIKRVIKEKSSTFYLNNVKTSTKDVSDFVKAHLNIKVDNLCQLLAQDRVSEFARLTPTQLLTETEKAMSDSHLFQWHEELKAHGDKASDQKTQIDSLQKQLKKNNTEVASLEKSVAQFRTKKSLERKVAVMKALEAWKEYYDCVNEKNADAMRLKKCRRAIAKKAETLKPFNRLKAKWHRVNTLAVRRLKAQTTKLKKQEKLLTATNKRIRSISEHIEDFQSKIKQAEVNFREDQRGLNKIHREIAVLEKLALEMNENDRMQELQNKRSAFSAKNSQLLQLRGKRQHCENQITAIDNQRSNVDQQLRRINVRLEQLQNVNQQRDRHLFENKHSDRQFFQWVQSQRHNFRGTVCGPICREMVVRDDQLATFLNNAIPMSILYGYVCTNVQDWDLLSKQSRTMGVRCTIISREEPGNHNNNSNNNNNNNSNNNSSSPPQLSQYDSSAIRRQVSIQYLNENGVDGYLDDAYEAMALVKLVLNDNASLCHKAYCRRGMSTEQLENVLLTYSGQRSRLSTLFCANTQYRCTPSSYDKNVARSVSNIRRHAHPILVVMPDHTAAIAELQQNREQHYNKLQTTEADKKRISTEKSEHMAEITKLQEQRKEWTNELKRYKTCMRKLEKNREKLEGRATVEDLQREKEKHTAQIRKGNANQVEGFARMAAHLRALEAMGRVRSELVVQQIHAKISALYYVEKIKRKAEKYQDIRAAEKRLQRTVHVLELQSQKLKRRNKSQFPRNEFKHEWTAEMKEMNADGIDEELSALEGRMSAISYNVLSVKRYDKLLKLVAKDEKSLEKLQSTLHDQSEKIDVILKAWKPQLRRNIAKISKRFGYFFRQFKADGKLELVEHEWDYNQWSINILTRFRTNEDNPFEQLSASAQSGGEKSVATMIYLLSLQEVTTVPFRVVDEINQGMDPINERRIMQILNNECIPRAANKHTIPQYFVVTPKLLPNLKYTPFNAIHLIFNGPWQTAQEQFLPWQGTQRQAYTQGGYADSYSTQAFAIEGNHSNTRNNTNNNNADDDMSEDEDDDSTGSGDEDEDEDEDESSDDSSEESG